MTNEQLINELSKHPKDSRVVFMVFSNLNIRRCDIPDAKVAHVDHFNELAIMLDVDGNWEEDVKRRIKAESH